MIRSILYLSFTLVTLLTATGQDPLRIQWQTYYLDPVTGKMIPKYTFSYQYDGSGRVRADLYSYWDNKELKFYPESRREYDYDAQGRKTEERSYYYQNLTDIIWMTYIQRWEYDAQGRVTVYSNSRTEHNSNRTEGYIITNTYSTEGCLIRKDIETEYIEGGSLWRDFLRSEVYTVDSQCRMLLKQTNSYTGYTAELETFAYDGNNLIAEREYTVNGTDTLMNYEALYEYNALNQVIVKETSSLRNNIYWKNREETQYNNEGKVAQETSYHWDQQLSEWVKTQITSYQYTNQGLLEEVFTEAYLNNGTTDSRFEYYEYNESDKRVRLYIRTVYTNSDGTIFDDEYEYLTDYRCDGAELSTNYYSLTGGIRQHTGAYYLVYLTPAPCEKQAEEGFQIFPNPTIGLVTLIPSQPFESYVIRVFNSSGQFIREYTSEQGVSPAYMDFSEFGAGIYIITLTGPGYATSKQLVKN